MADHDLLAALITCWSNDLTSTDPAISQDARGLLALYRKVGANKNPLIDGACRVTGLEPEKVLDVIEARAQRLERGQEIASRPRPLTAPRKAKAKC